MEESNKGVWFYTASTHQVEPLYQVWLFEYAYSIYYNLFIVGP
jgi:hypothetical protein